MLGMLGRFEDPLVEQTYVRSEREARVPATRFLAAVGIVTLISYIGFNPLHFPIEGVLEYNMAAGPFVLLLVGLFALTFTKFYIEHAWIDVVIFTIMAVVMVLLIEALGAQAEITGITRFGMAVINLGILLVFASVGFVATSRYYVAWAALLLVLYILFLLQADRTLVNKVYTFTNFTTYFTFACFVNLDIDRRARKTFAARRALEEERAKTEEMLHNVLPADVAERLRRDEVIADSFSDVSVVFVDIVGFSKLARKLSPGHLVKLLNTVFGFADDCAQQYGVEKVKTIGDAYLAVAGGTASHGKDAEAAMGFAKCVLEQVRQYADQTKIDLQVRIGIHTGAAVGGVVGQQRMIYDYWGDTLNTAERIQGASHPGGIAVSESTFLALCTSESFSEPELITLKGIGETKVYRVILDDPALEPSLTA